MPSILIGSLVLKIRKGCEIVSHERRQSKGMIFKNLGNQAIKNPRSVEQ
jgi:hypothetical protein